MKGGLRNEGGREDGALYIGPRRLEKVVVEAHQMVDQAQTGDIAVYVGANAEQSTGEMRDSRALQSTCQSSMVPWIFGREGEREG